MKQIRRLLPSFARDGARAARERFIRSPLPRCLPFLAHTYRWQRPSAIILPQHKLVYVPVPKVANRSLKAALADFAAKPYTDPHDAGWQFIPLSRLAGLDGTFRFTFVRNPLDRLLSCYAQKIALYARQMELPLLFWRYGGRFDPQMSFAEFVTAVANIPDHLADRHFRSQHTFLYHKGQRLVDFVGRYEQLEEDWTLLSRQVGFGPLPHYNPSPHKPYPEMYTPELARLAAARYEEDIALFGYGEAIAPLLGGP